MSRFIIALFLLLAAHQANAECGSTANRVGCTTPNGAVGVGPNGAATYNKNTGEVHTAQPEELLPFEPGHARHERARRGR